MKTLIPTVMVPKSRRPIVDKMCASCPFNADRGAPKIKVSDEDMAAFKQQATLGEFYCHETVLEDRRTKRDKSGNAVGVQPHFKVCRGAWEHKLAVIRDRDQPAQVKEKAMKPVAYVAADVDGGWGVSICEQGVEGHRPVQDYSGPYKVEQAEGIATRLNLRLGLNEKQARLIIMTTMPSYQKRRKPRRKHSWSGVIRCEICAPLRCARAK